jgi:tyrosinase
VVCGLCSEAVSHILHSPSNHTHTSTLRSAANGPFTIYFFLSLSGEITTDPTKYGQSPHLAGLNHIFAAPREVCSNCGDLEAAGQLASDTSPITPLLLDYLEAPDNGLESLRPEHVKPFLVKYLRWRVVYVSCSFLTSC